MRTKTSEVLSIEEENVTGEYTIKYNYSVKEGKIQGAITATLHPYGSMSSYDGVTMNSHLAYEIGDTDKSGIEEQMIIDISEIWHSI